jgi:methionyl-tRNA formyltransferase
MKKENIKIIFMGTPQFAADILNEIIEIKYNIISVYTQPDKKFGRNQDVFLSPVKRLALGNKIKIFQPDNLKNEDVLKNIKESNPDLIVVAAYGKILPKEILEIPLFGCLNIHASLLPKFRGASPIQNAILAGEKETGVTLMLMSEKMDAGDILKQIKIKISDSDTTEYLTQKLSRLGKEVIGENLSKWILGKIKPEKQDEKSATFCRTIKRENGLVDWEKTAEEIYNLWRAFQPWPGIYTIVKLKNEERRIKLVEIGINSSFDSSEKIGKVVEFNQKKAVQTGKGIVILKKIQLEGKKTTSMEDFQRGYPNFTIAV